MRLNKRDSMRQRAGHRHWIEPFFRTSAGYFGLEACPAVFKEAFERIRERDCPAGLAESGADRPACEGEPVV